MDEYLAVRTPPPLSSDGKEATGIAMGVGLVLILSLMLLLCFTPRAWADTEDAKQYSFVVASESSLSITYEVNYFKDSRNPINFLVSQKTTWNDGKHGYQTTESQDTWRYAIHPGENTDSGIFFGSHSYDFYGSEVSPIKDFWSSDGNPYSVYVNGTKIGGSDEPGNHFINVYWDGLVKSRASFDEPYGNVDMWVRGFNDGSSSPAFEYRPMGRNTVYNPWVSDGWQLMTPGFEQPQHGGPGYRMGACTIEFVQYHRVEKPSKETAPSVSLEHEDGTAYSEGTWTNKNVVAMATSTDRKGGYFTSLFKSDGSGEVARSAWAESPTDRDVTARYVISKSTPVEGVGFFGVLLGSDGSPLSSESAAKTVKVDKEAPVISGISASGGAASVSASDALSGVAAIEGRGLGSDDWVPIGEISLSGKSGTLSVRVTDNAGNTTVGTVSVRGGNIDPPDGGGDDGSDAGSREGDGFRARRSA